MDKKEELDRQRSLFLSLLEALSKHLDEGSSDKEADTKIDKGMMMVQEGEKKNDEGKKKNEEGKDMIAKGLKLVEEGNKLVEEGNKLVEEGNKLVESGNKSVDEGNQMKQSIKKNNITKGMLDEIRACAYELFGVKDSRQLSIFGNVQPTQDQGKEDKRVVVWELENLMSSDDAASYKECMKMVKNRGHLNLIVSNKSITEITEDLIVNDMSEYVQPENVFGFIKNFHVEFAKILNKFDKQQLVIISKNMDTKEFFVKHGFVVRFINSNIDMLKLMNEFAAPPQFYSSDNTSVPEKVQALQVQLVENKWVLIWEFDNLQIDAASYKECMKLLSDRGHLNVIISNKSVIDVFKALKLYDMTEYVKQENVFYIVGNYLSELRKIVKNFENQLLVTVSKNKATKEFLDKIGFFTLHISSDNDISQLFDKLKTTFSQPSSDFPGSTDKKLCKYCNEEIDQESFVIHVVRCKILKKKKADEAVTCSAKKPKLN